MKKRWKIIVLLVVLTILLTGCSDVREGINSAVDAQKTVNIEDIQFPEGWALDETESDATTFTYAPGGDMINAGCMIQISEEYVGFDFFTTYILGNPKVSGWILKKTFESGGATNIEFKDCGETLIGTTTKITMDLEEYGYVVPMEVYFSTEAGFQYMVSNVDSYGTNASDVTAEILGIE